MTKSEKKGIQAFFELRKAKLDNGEDSSDEEDCPGTPPETVDETAVVTEVSRPPKSKAKAVVVFRALMRPVRLPSASASDECEPFNEIRAIL